jgi:mono/diheme cytochrome c family protein
MKPIDSRPGIAAVLAVVLALSAAVSVAVAAPRGGSSNTPAMKRAKVLFVAACGSCHTLPAAGTRGTVGPNLAQEGSSYWDVVSQVQRGGDGMPSFAKSLSSSQIARIATFVAATTSSGG